MAQWFTDGFLRSTESRRARQGPQDPMHGVDPRGRPVPALRPQRARARHAARSRRPHAPGRAAEPRRRDGARPVPGRKAAAALREAAGDPPRQQADRRRQPAGDGQRRGERADRLRDVQHAVPARAQPDRPRDPGRATALGARTDLRRGAQRADRAPHPARDRGVHQPPAPLPLPLPAGPARLRQAALDASELGRGRVQPAVPLAQPRPRHARHRWPASPSHSGTRCTRPSRCSRDRAWRR